MMKKRNVLTVLVSIFVIIFTVTTLTACQSLIQNNLEGKNNVLPKGTVVPSWYAPQKLKVTTVTYNAGGNFPTSNAVSEGALLPLADVSPNDPTLDVSDVPADSASSEPSSSSSTTDSDNITARITKFNVIYYTNPNTNQVIEPFSYIREKMKLGDDTYIYMIDYGFDRYGSKPWDYIYYFTYQKNADGSHLNPTGYCIDIKNGEYKKLPSQIKWNDVLINVKADGKYMSAAEGLGNDYLKLSVVNLQDMSVKLVAEKTVMCAPQLSANDNFLIYATGTPYNPQMGHFYNFETGAIIDCPVEVDDRGNGYGEEIALKYGSKCTADQFFDNDRYYIGISTKDHITPIIVDTATGETVDDSVVENNIGRYSIGGDWTREDSDVYRFDYLSDDQPVIIPNGLLNSDTETCYITSTDGRYVYVYTSGNDYIKCIDVMSLEHFNVYISPEFNSQIAKLEAVGIYANHFNIQVSSDNTQVMLNFRLSDSPSTIFYNPSADPHDPHFHENFPALEINVFAQPQSYIKKRFLSDI